MALSRVRTAKRRGALLALAMAALLAVIAACGGGDDATPTSAAPTATSPAPGEAPVAPTPTATTPPRPAWEIEWEGTIAAAKEEGIMVVAVGRAAYRTSAEKLSEFFPDIVVESRVGSGLEERILLEQEAGIFGVDVQLTGGPTVIITLVPAGAAGDTRSVLFRPDVIDDENWVGNFDDHWMDDDTRKHTFGYQATQASASFTVNTKLVPGDPQDFDLDNLFTPEFKGKWCLQDPRGRGAAQQFAAMVMATRGKDYFRQLLVETDPWVSSDVRALSESIIRDEFAFCVGTSETDQFHLQGLGLHVVDIVAEWPTVHPDFQGRFLSSCCGTGAGKDSNFDGFFGSGTGGPTLIKDAPHPNVAKLFLNWLLTHDGAIAWLEPRNFEHCNPRVDMQEFCREGTRLEEGKAYVAFDRTSTVGIRDEAAAISREVFGGR